MKKLKVKPKKKSVAKRKSVRTSESASVRPQETRAARRILAPSVHELLSMALLRAEKCQLKEARENYQLVLEIAKEQADLRNMMEAVAGLLRLANEALDEVALKRLEQELDEMMEAHPKQVPPMAWYCKGYIIWQRDDYSLAQRYTHRFLRELRKEHASEPSSSDLLSNDDLIARGWIMMAILLWRRGHVKRALHLVQILLSRFESRNLHSVNGLLYILNANIYEGEQKLEESMKWFQKAHVAFLAGHSWYYHLYVLYGYARLARKQRNFSQAYWYLDLIEKAVMSSEFGLLRREVAREKKLLESDAVDLLIDSRQCVIQTREAGEITLGKQYVLLHILEALSRAHHGSEADRERGLSKAEIIERVWKEKYRPEAHDNKLYYNINRLRKLIEPDVHKPKYLVNWREGYRLAPGLKVQFIGANANSTVKNQQLDEAEA